MEANKIIHIKEEEEDFYSDDDLYNISSWGADLSFREIISMYDEGELVKPELQRKYVWDKPEASRFIESLLLGLPVPSIFLANTKDNRKLIIDGYQRVMTVFDYVTGVWQTDNKVFKLSNTEKINERWRGLAFGELNPTDQRKIRSTTIHAIIFEQKSPADNDTSLYQVFERINTGGRTLLPQEIRNCINQGKFNDLLFRLNKNLDWRELYGSKKEDSRMRDLEFILRFLALDTEFIRKHESTGAISLKKYLNNFMASKNSLKPSTISEREAKFEDVLRFVKQHIGSNAFFNIAGDDISKIRKRFYPTIFDSICVAVAIGLREKGGALNKKDLEHRRLQMLVDENYRKYISEGTMRIDHIHGRINAALRYLFDINR